MSRVGEQPVPIPKGVTVTVEGQAVRAKGPKGELAVELAGPITADVVDSAVVLKRADNTREARSLHGTMNSLVANMVEGVGKGFAKELLIEGVGYRAALQGRKLVVTLGFSSPVEYTVPDGVTIEIEGGTALKISGADKQKVGEVAARIVAFYPAEPYKGKGIRYKGVHIRRKVGKTVA